MRMGRTARARAARALLAFTGALAIAGCAVLGGGDDDEAIDPDTGVASEAAVKKDGASRGLGVNQFLWTASLETLNFMPLSFADPYGGVIATDWFADPGQPEERFRATVYILDNRLRADGLRVSVFRQQRGAGAGWTDAAVNPETSVQIENAILTRARQLRLDTDR